MANPSKFEIINSKPIGEGLAAFRDAFRSTCANLGISTSIDAVHQTGDGVLQNLVVDLIFALQHQPAAQLLPSRTGRGSLRSDLLSLGSWAVSDDFDVERITPLLNAVINKESDEELWKKVSIAVTKSTPPPRPLPNLDQSPYSFNTSSFVNTSEHRKHVDDVLKVELGSSLHIGVPGFYKTFFGEIADLRTVAATVFMKCQNGDNPLYSDERGWRDWPDGAKEKDVLKWFAVLIEVFLEFAGEGGSALKIRRRPLAQPDQALEGSTAKHKLDIGFVSNPKANENTRCHWSQILVPGELKSNPDVDKHSKRYAREVLTAQDTRRFVLGFTLCGSIMRLWEFDRLGGIASTPFDINRDGLQFISVVLGYLWMNEEQLGFDPTIFESEGKRYIEIIRNDQKERIVLSGLIKRAPCVAGRATTCWKAYREGDESRRPLVIKDSWQYPERDEEGESVREATKKGVVNVARYYHHEKVRVGGEYDYIRNNVRKGLDFTQATNYARKSIMLPSISGLHGSTGKGRSDSTAKRKRSSSCTDVPLPPSKRICSSSPTKGREDLAEWDRVHYRVIVSDYGKPIYKASSRSAMLAALEGNITGHESYRKHTHKLQGDISIGNLMMNEDKDNPSLSSFLIDFDLAIKERREEPSGARAKTGTRVFMAIGVLYGERHSFMHDLESFFWVLFWICIHYNGPNEKSRVVPRFEKWDYMDMEELAKTKKGEVDDEGDFLKTVEEHFTPYYQPLIPWANRLRKGVFPRGGRWKEEDSRLYSRMKEILREARKDPNISGRFYAMDEQAAVDEKDVIRGVLPKPPLKAITVPYRPIIVPFRYSVYQALSVDRHDIRLLEIPLSAGSELISCNLIPFSLNEKPQYAALSDEESNPGSMGHLELNGHRFSVKKRVISTIYQFMTAAKDCGYGGYGKAVRLWADAVCINHANLSERNSQVQLMREIFANAKVVWAWSSNPKDTPLERGVDPNEVKEVVSMSDVDKDTAFARGVDPSEAKGVDPVAEAMKRQAQERRKKVQISSNRSSTGWQDMVRNHTYEQLPLEPSIRLLQVLDPSPDGNVNCVLTIHGLTDLPSYRALSYTWGPPSSLASERGITADRSYPISCNGGILMVTKNLLDALSYMQRTRLTTSEDYIWIDAICINQDDEDEKSSQVYMMFDIYKAAQLVIMWLGEEDEDTSLALEILPSVAAIPHDRLRDFDNCDLDAMNHVIEEYTSPHSPEHWRALTMLMQRHWFNRVWIIQEFFAAKEVSILCGSSTISWEHLVEASHFFAIPLLGRMVLRELVGNFPGFEKSSLEAISHAYKLSRFQSQLNKSIQPLHLMEYLALGSDFGATNPRDKVYALLGVAARTSKFHPNYRLDVETVFVDATRYVINESQDLAILSAVEYTRDKANLGNINSLPSWVPNFNIQVDFPFRKPLVAANLPSPRIAWLSDPRMLRISGAKLDEIFYIEDGSTGPRIEGISQWLRILFFSEPTYLNGEARLEALGRTLIENSIGEASNSVGVLMLFQLWMAQEVARILIEDRRTGLESDRARLIYGSLMAIGTFEPPLPPGSILSSTFVESFVSILNGEALNEDEIGAARLAHRYEDFIMSTRRSKAFLTGRGRFGTAPITAEWRDTIWIVPGASDPLLFRPTGHSDHFRLLGYVYLHGFDLDDVLHNERLDWQDIILE